jgi:hypothetical protein
MSDRPEHVACIVKEAVIHDEYEAVIHDEYAWCGRFLFREFRFLDLDHVVTSMAAPGNNLRICPECAEAAIQMLRLGKYEGET